jgi:hypothetical protein
MRQVSETYQIHGVLIACNLGAAVQPSVLVQVQLLRTQANTMSLFVLVRRYYLQRQLTTDRKEDSHAIVVTACWILNHLHRRRDLQVRGSTMKSSDACSSDCTKQEIEPELRHYEPSTEIKPHNPIRVRTMFTFGIPHEPLSTFTVVSCVRQGTGWR